MGKTADLSTLAESAIQHLRTFVADGADRALWAGDPVYDAVAQLRDALPESDIQYDSKSGDRNFAPPGFNRWYKILNLSRDCEGETDPARIGVIVERLERAIDVFCKWLKTKYVEARPVLSTPANVVYEILLELPETCGLTGSELLKEMDNRGCPSDQSSLTTRYVPELKPYGIENVRGKGYFIPLSRRPQR